MVKTKNSSKIIAIISAIILFLSLAFVIIPNLDNSTSDEVYAESTSIAYFNTTGWRNDINTSSITEIAFTKQNKSDTGISVGAVSATDSTISDSVQAYVDGTKVTFNSDKDIYAQESLRECFKGLVNLEKITFSNFNTSLTKDMGQLFWRCKKLKTLDLSNFDATNVTSITYNPTDDFGFLALCESLESVTFGQNFTLSNVASFYNMFKGCTSLKSLDLSMFDTSSAINFSSMFANCSSLSTLDLSNFDTTNVTNMSGMFYGCNLKKLDISSFTINDSDVGGAMFKLPVEIFVMFIKGSTLYTTYFENYNFTDEDLIQLYSIENIDERKDVYVNRVVSVFREYINSNPEEVGEMADYTDEELKALLQEEIDNDSNFNTTISADSAFSSNIDEIIVPQSVPANAVLLPTSYNAVVNGVTGTDEINYLISGANITLVKATSGVVDTGVATDLFSFAVTGLIIIALAVISLRKKKVSR